MYARFAAGLLVLQLPAAFLLQAQQQPAARFVTGNLGAFVMSAPVYPGSDERWIVPLPIVDLRVAQRVYLGGGTNGLSGGAGVFLVETGGVAWSADFTLMSDRPEDRAEALAGMADRGFGAFMGSTIALRYGPLQATISGAKGVEDRMGAYATAGVSTWVPLPAGWFAQLGGLGVLADEDYQAWDFGVTGEQASRRGGMAYTPGGGLRELRANLIVGRALSPRVAVSGSGALVRLMDDAARSPLTRKRTGWEGGVGVSWRFQEQGSGIRDQGSGNSTCDGAP